MAGPRDGQRDQAGKKRGFQTSTSLLKQVKRGEAESLAAEAAGDSHTKSAQADFTANRRSLSILPQTL
jgi:hypothetical protein